MGTCVLTCMCYHLGIYLGCHLYVFSWVYLRCHIVSDLGIYLGCHLYVFHYGSLSAFILGPIMVIIYTYKVIIRMGCIVYTSCFYFFYIGHL